MKILFVGTGLIGGSFSLAMKRAGIEFESAGYSRKVQNLQRSQELGVIDRYFAEMNEGIHWADIIVLSIPVDVIKKILPGILDGIRQDQLVVDFGSTKGEICSGVESHPQRDRFLAAHPIAGTEYSGPDAAFATLYDNKVMIFCDSEKTNQKAFNEFKSISEKIQMRVAHLASEEHDRHLAYISHLSHITSYALSNAVLKKEEDGEVILDLAGSGFASTVRLAKSSPEMWTPIFIENQKMVLESVDAYLEQVMKFRDMLAASDGHAINDYLAEGRKIRKILD